MANDTHPIYPTDQYTMSYDVFGVTLTFSKRRHRSDEFAVPSPIPEDFPVPPPKNESWSEDQCSLFMNAEHTKAMVFLMHRQIGQTEGQIGKADLPQAFLERSGISVEDWNLFWYGIVDENPPEGDTDGDGDDPAKTREVDIPGSSGADGPDGKSPD